MAKNARKVRNQDINPCIEETSASQKCLDAYNYDKSMCSAYFQRYRDCRKYWHNIMLQRRRDGVSPDMPTAAERQEMLAAIGGKPYWGAMKVTQRHCEDQSEHCEDVFYRSTHSGDDTTLQERSVYCNASSGHMEETACSLSLFSNTMERQERHRRQDIRLIVYWVLIMMWHERTQYDRN